MLEIGLGCSMAYGPGVSVKAWQLILPNVELWEADIDKDCVKINQENGKLDGIHTVVGDQSNPKNVEQWVNESGGNFDIVIDDGGHMNEQIKTSFDGLWPHLAKGGLYFIEDLQMGRQFDHTGGKAVMADIIHNWTEQLLIPTRNSSFPLPPDVSFILCQREACVIAKK